jgi:hypothetical protein
MLDDHQLLTQFCEECELLTRRWIEASEQLSRSIAELTGKMGTVPKHVYETLYRSAEDSRRLAHTAEKALTSHRKAHHILACDRRTTMG